MEAVTDKWGIRINRIEIVEITPPPQILQALALQKQADQEKRAKILQSEGLQQSAVNVADGNRQAAIKSAEGERQSAILRAEGNRQAAILEAEGRAQAIKTVYDAIKAAGPRPDPGRDPPARHALEVRRQPEHEDRHPGRELGAARRGQALRSVLGRRADPPVQRLALAAVPRDGAAEPVARSIRRRQAEPGLQRGRARGIDGRDRRLPGVPAPRRVARAGGPREGRPARGGGVLGPAAPRVRGPDARVLIVGLAPAAHGGNRTGRVFTGDRSGDVLWAALHATGFADRAGVVGALTTG